MTPEMVISLCDAVLSGGLPAEALETIGFALVVSDTFTRDSDQVLGEVIADWSAPEIHLPLTLDNVRRFRSWVKGRRAISLEPTGTPEMPRLVSLRRKIIL